MGVYDRDYVFNRKRGFAGTPFSVTMLLIGINVAAFLLQFFLSRAPGGGGRDMFFEFGHFSTYRVTWQGGLQFWRFLTFQFLHGGPMHLFMNMFGLYMFGQMVEQHLGPKKYLAFYLTCGLFGALFYFVLNALGAVIGSVPGLLINDPRTPLVGASAGVFGVIVACARIAPDTVVQLMFPPVPVRLKMLAYAYVGISLVSLLLGVKNAGGEAAHLGGAAAGYFFIRNSHLLRDFFDVFSDSRRPSPSGQPRLRIVRDDEELDRLLTRVNEVGHANLTAKEKKRLSELTRKMNESDKSA
jgi:membrane associated rhomboid family serine protease